MEISHYQQFADDMVTPGVYAAFAGGGFFIDTNAGAGIIDPLSEYNNYWLEVGSNEIIGLEALDLSYKLKSETDLSNFDGSNYDFALSTGLTVFADVTNAKTAYNFIKAWLIDNVTAPNNSIAVKLTKLDCPNIVITNLNINLNQIRWDNKRCAIEIDMKEIQPRVSCFERTLIHDNFQGWFNQDTTFNHPRFKYCNKVSSYLILIMMSILNSALFPFFALEIMVNTIIDAINNITGGNIGYWTPFSGFLADMIYKIVGCKWEHTAPLIRTYFQNVCDKCGITYNSTSDVFNSPVLSYALNDGSDPSYGGNNPYYNTVMFYPRGEIKGMKTGDSQRRWRDAYQSFYTGFILAEELKKVFNAEWRIFNNEFCFYKKGEGGYINLNALVFDFTQSPDADLLINNVFEYEWDEQPRYAYMRGVWAENDALDSNNADVVNSWNSIVDFNLAKNPNFKGEKNNISDFFATTQYRFDNTDRDYVLDGIVGTFGSIYTNLPAAIQIQVDVVLAEVPEHAILLQGKNVEKARLMIWDPALSGNDDYVNSNSYSAFIQVTNFGVDPSTFENGYTPLPDAGGYVNPVPDPYYNHPIGIYAAQSYTYNHLPNYGENYYPKYYIYSLPIHFDEMFKYTLYNNFFKLDDPQFSPPMRIKTTCEIKACCDTFDRLGINGSGLIQLNCKVRVPANNTAGYYDVIIYEIKYSAETETIKLSLRTNKYN